MQSGEMRDSTEVDLNVPQEAINVPCLLQEIQGQQCGTELAACRRLQLISFIHFSEEFQ